MNKTHQINHERLEVYKRSIQLLALTTSISQTLPRGNGEIKDQFKRASLSVVLNIAEGYGKYNRKDKVRFYQISKGSAHECAAIFDCLEVLGIVESEHYLRGKRLCYEVICMLVALCK